MNMLDMIVQEKFYKKQIHNNAQKQLLDTIGNTPLIAVCADTQKQDDYPLIYAKLEYLNPGGSVKDRSALYMIEYAEEHGLLKPGGTIIDASSGNQGIAVAMIGAIKGYKVIITMSDKVSAEKLNTIKAYGAQVVICPSTPFITDQDNYHARAVALQKETPNSFMPNQYFNPLNAQAHYALLGPELWQQTNGLVTHFFAGAGTGGTVSGVGRYLKEQNPEVKVFAVDSDTSFRSTCGNPKPYKLEGIGIDWDGSPVLDYSVIDEFVPVSDANAIATLKKLASTQGLLVGPSSGAVAYAAFEFAKKCPKDAVIAMIFGDSGRAYLTKGFYSESM
jgi:cystathionine beta-synthase